MLYKESSWKDKVDPAFDKLIIFFLEVLEVVKLPANEGYICISQEDPHFQMLGEKGFPDFKSYYEIKNKKDFLAIIRDMLSGLPGGNKPLKDLEELFSDFMTVWFGIAQKDEDTIKKVVEKILGSLKEESRYYYTKCFSVAVKITEKMNVQDQAKLVRSIISNILSLFANRIFLVAEKNRDAVKQLNPIYIQNVFFSVWNIISIVINSKTLRTLYNEARAGVDQSLFEIIQIDKTLFDHDWVRDRIRKAAYSGNKLFFQSLSKAIKDDPLKNRKLRIKEFLILTVFWELGLYRLSAGNLLELFNDCGLAKREDEITFRKFRDRFIKKRPKLWAISNFF